MFEDGGIDVVDGTADGGLAGETTCGGLKSGQQLSDMKRRPVGNGSGTTLVVEHGGEDDAPDEGPFELLAACFARIRESGKHGHDTAILGVVHCLPPLSLVTPAIVNDGPALDYGLI